MRLRCSGDVQPLLPAPPAGQGIQLNMGPFDVPRLDTTQPVPPGVVPGEVLLCRTLKLSNTDPIFVNRIKVAMNQGSRDLMIFRSKLDFPDQWFPCWGTVNFDDWEFVVGVNKTGGDDWPLDPGQAFLLEPHQQLMIRSHFVNAATAGAPLRGMVTINMYTTPQANVQHVLRDVFATNMAINIPPHSAARTPPLFCAFSRNVAIVAMIGDFHKRGTLFDVHRVDQFASFGGVVQTIDRGGIYENTNWDSPLFQRFSPSMPIDGIAPYGQGLRFDCSYFNDTDSWIGSGNADVHEHCKLFVQYYDSVDTSLNPPLLTCSDRTGTAW